MKFYLIHHAHTDVGYTDRQEKIAWNHAKYLESVIDILRSAEKKEAWQGFCWNVEAFWMAEQLLRFSTPEYIEAFWQYVRDGKIGLSGSYLNCTDLMDDRVLRETLESCRETAEKNGVTLRSAMTADINGYPWGFASALADAGIRYLLSAVHTHHGYHAAGKKQFPFYWEGPDGKRLLVWQSEHYHLGNEMNIHQWSGQYGYMIHDGLPGTGLTNWELSKRRLFAYARQLQEDGFPFDFCPILVSGLCTDNSPPGPRIAEFMHRWNAENGDQIQLEMTTLDHFFAQVEKHAADLPVYRGDWTDWWADGVCSTPFPVAHYREAVRKFRLCRFMDPQCAVVSSELMKAARQDLMLYSEHTWGHSASVSDPAHPMVNLLDMRKTLYAARANEAASLCVDALTAHLGETPMVIWKDFRIHAVNPTPVPMTAPARVEFEILFNHRHFRLVNEKTGKPIPHQLVRTARGSQINFLPALQPGEHCVYRVEELPPAAPPMLGMYCNYGADGVQDLAFDRFQDPDWACTPFELITPHMHVRWEMDKGIVSIRDRQRDTELITDPGEGAFQPIYECTPIRTDPCTERRRMGRNRKAPHTHRDFGRLYDVEVTDFGPVLSRVILRYEVDGCQSADLILTAWRGQARLDVDFRLHKGSRLEPENLYLALPFARKDATLYADKTGCVFRPRIDQLPGACADYYALQNALAWVQNGRAIMIETADAPMIAMGTLLPHDIRLSGDPALKNTDRVYSWVMNNFWETNFKVSLGGFYTFHYTLRLLDSDSPAALFPLAQAENTGTLCFHSFDVEE